MFTKKDILFFLLQDSMGSVPRRRSPSSSIQSATRGSWTWWRRRRRIGTSGWTLSPTLWPLSRVLPSKGNTKCESQKKFVPHFKCLMLRFLGRQFQKADANKSGFLSFDEIKKLCHRLNIKVNKEKMQTLAAIVSNPLASTSILYHSEKKSSLKRQSPNKFLMDTPLFCFEEVNF